MYPSSDIHVKTENWWPSFIFFVKVEFCCHIFPRVETGHGKKSYSPLSINHYSSSKVCRASENGPRGAKLSFKNNKNNKNK